MYTTDALVCNSYERNATDGAFALFTHDYGLLYATARGVREERSRQRYGLQPFSRIRVSLIRGKTGWRIGSVTPLENFYTQARTRQDRAVVVSIFRLVNRFIQGEESLPDLYQFLHEALQVVRDGGVRDRVSFIQLVTARFLAQLGHIDSAQAPVPVPHTMSTIVECKLDDAALYQLTVFNHNATHVSQL